MNTSFLIGDKIGRPKAEGLVQHVGIYLGVHGVFHHLPGKNAHISTLHEFAAGQEVTLAERKADLDLAQLNERAIESLRKAKPYHLTDFNCEDAANYVLHGRIGSPQALFWIVAAVIALAGAGYVIYKNLQGPATKRA
jgi:hypothetical protein